MRTWRTNHTLLVVTCTLSIAACSSSSSEDELLKEAAAVHNTMLKTAGELKNELNVIRRDSTAQLSLDSIHELKADFEQWEAEVVEVPGNEQHHHETNVNHDHTPLNVTAREMLNIQVDLNRRLDSIARRFKTLTGK